MPTFKPDLAVIIPIFNEESSLMAMAEGLADHLDDIVGKERWTYVMVDNGSKDGTRKVAQEITSRWCSSKYLRLDKANYGEALSVGLKAASTQYTYIINVDFWDPIFLHWSWHHRESYDLIIGSKRSDFSLNQQLPFRTMLSWGLNTMLKFAFGFVGTDTHGQKFLKMETMENILKVTEMRQAQFDTEFTLRAQRSGLKLAEVPVPIKEYRKPRNPMIRKLIFNLIGTVGLWRVVRKIPTLRAPQFHRFARKDMLNIAKK